MLDEDTLDAIARFVALAGPDPTPVQEEMAEYADEHRFPIIGPGVGGLLSILARVVGVERAVEFGSGYGYSASWIARALPVGGEVIATEYDADNVALGREFAEQGGYDDTVRFETGDAVGIVDGYDGPFGMVLLDHEKHRYVQGLETVRGKVPEGGIVIADNLMSGPADFEEVFAALEGEGVGNDSARGLAAYVEHVRDDPDFEATVVPMGSGISLAVKVG